MENLVFILDNIRSAFNVGSIFRLADAVNAKVYCCGICPTPTHEKVIKTALWAEKNVLWKRFESVDSAIKAAKEDGFCIYSVEKTEEAKNFFDIDFEEKAALVFGHEIMGVSKIARKLSDKVVKIPMYGKKKSLNVAMAAGIVAYEVIRQWQEKGNLGKEKKQQI